MLTAFFNVVYVTVKVEFLLFVSFILCLSVEGCTVAIELPLTFWGFAIAESFTTKLHSEN
jgi:hypothetical protein